MRKQRSIMRPEAVTRARRRWWPFDLRWLVWLIYPNDRVTQLLTQNPIPLTRRRLGYLWALLKGAVFEEWIRFYRPFTPSKPNGVAIEITNACNLRCKMCNLVAMKRPPRLMSLDVYRRVIDRCAEAKIPNVRLHTYGETLLHPNLAEMLAYARAAGLDVWISTNAQLLDAEVGRRVLEAGVSTVRYSVEGASPATYERIRKGGSWDRLLGNMKKFKELRDELSPGTAIAINTVLMADTIGEIHRMQEVFGPFVDEIHISPLEALGSQGWKLAQGNWLEAVDLTQRIPCRLLWDMMNISVDGKATLCCADVEAEVPVGDALEQDLLSIWRGPALQRARRLHRARQFDEIGLCSACSFGATNTAVNRYRYALLNDRVSYGRRVR